MIRHCVFFRFRPEVPQAERDVIYAGLGALVGRIPGLLSAQFGPNSSPEGLSQGFNDGFIMELADREARDRYLTDPEHQQAGARLVAALEGGRDGLVVFDLEVN